MSYHTQEAMNARLTARRENPTPVDPLAVFYHASLMNGWEAIVAEQFDLLAHVGLTSVKSFVLARPGAVGRFLEIAEHYGVVVELLGVSDDFGSYERPTLNALHEWCGRNPNGGVIYLHTKGVSSPNDAHKRHWRRVMARYLIGEWRRCAELLQIADMAGVAWQATPDYPHWQGNFWAARADWLWNLEYPDTYRLSRPDFRWAGAHSWRERMHVETWVGSRGYHHLEDLLGHNFKLYLNDCFGVDTRVPGHEYDRPLYLGQGLTHGSQPFRWWIQDDAVAACENVPGPDSEAWEARYENDAEQHKRTTRKLGQLPANMAGVVERIRSDAVRDWWGGQVGYGLSDDPTLHGGGIHVTGPGGWLNTHLDYDLHPLVAGKRRAVNVIAFLNSEWKEEWGGALVLCDAMGAPVVRIHPRPGRVVAFEVGDTSYHGVEPITGPVERVTAAVYYLSPAGPQNTRKRALFMPDRRHPVARG